MDDLLEVFLVETLEGLTECEADVDRFCETPSDDRARANIFRLISSIRETSNFLGLPALHVAAAAAVKPLSDLKKGAPSADGNVGDALRRAIGEIKALITKLMQSAAGADPIYEAEQRAGKPATEVVLGASTPETTDAVSPSAPTASIQAMAAPVEAGSADCQGTTPSGGSAATNRPGIPPAGPRPVDLAPAGEGMVRIRAETLDNILATVRQLMASQAEMMQMIKSRDEAAKPVAPAAAGDPVVSAAPAPAQPEPTSVDPVPQGAATTTVGDAPADPDKIEIAAEKIVPLPSRRPAAAESALSGIRAAPAPKPEIVKLMVFQTSSGATKAVRAELVDHVREIDLKDLDGARGLWVLRTDSRLIPLVPVDGGARQLADKHMIAIMCCIGGAWMGLLAHSIIGTVETTLVMLRPGGRHNQIATTVIDQTSVDVIDPARCLGDAIDGRAHKSRPPEAPRTTRAANPPTAALATDLFGRKPTP